jgi:non-canonical purine NTP pyrophosphatase (RdgB/HAM1 family)
MDLLISTSNPGKVREYAEILSELPYRLLNLRDVGLESLEVDEPHETYAENAARKALAYAKASSLNALADDSGLEVNALGGRPGVYSARYGGPTDRDRNLKLLAEMETIPELDRAAQFVCVVAIANPQTGDVEYGCGTCEGKIGYEICDGTGGFGYDAVFIPTNYEVCFSDLPSGVKHSLSHRGNAIRNLIPFLRQMADT